MLTQAYQKIRQRSIDICCNLETEDYVVQPVEFVSPPKWHIGHTTWFFETFVLLPHFEGYKIFNPQYNFVFNSYYETIGARTIRTDRGNLSRPTVADIYHYREYVDNEMVQFINSGPAKNIIDLIILGLNHEQQHQELLATDIKYILGHNPLFPSFANEEKKCVKQNIDFIQVPEGIYEIGHEGDGFCFDNEMGRHKVYLNNFEISSELVSNEDYKNFIEDGGYKNFKFWHAEGWDWVKTNEIQSPLYWHLIEGKYFNYTLAGLKEINLAAPVNHISYYEAYAFVNWKGMRLPTEFEWEAASHLFDWGERWEWTESAYLPYPGFKKAEGAIGEYNGKFMVNQKVLRGSSEVTPPGHSRKTYRNFFHPDLRWQYTGIRLAK